MPDLGPSHTDRIHAERLQRPVPTPPHRAPRNDEPAAIALTAFTVVLAAIIVALNLG